MTAEHQHKPNLSTNIICLLIRGKCNLPLVEQLLAKCIFVQLYHNLPLLFTICYWYSGKELYKHVHRIASYTGYSDCRSEEILTC